MGFHSKSRLCKCQIWANRQPNLDRSWLIYVDLAVGGLLSWH